MSEAGVAEGEAEVRSDILSAPDSEFHEMDIDAVADKAEAEAEAEAEAVDDADEVDDVDENEEQTDSGEEEDDDDDTDGDTQENVAESGGEVEDDSDIADGKDGLDTEEDTQETSTVDYEGEYQRMMSPFKANGEEMQAANTEDAITLMKMGANYTKKMAVLKPNLKLIKMLQKNDLLDIDKLNKMIDLSKKKPEAVAKMIKDSGIDPLDIDVDKAEEYNPTNYEVSDSEYNLDSAIEDIKDTPTYDKTMKVLGETMDDASKNIIVDHPDIIGALNEHIGNGTYDKVMSIVNRERAVGRLANISILEAYRNVFGSLVEQGVALDQGAVGRANSKAKQKQNAGQAKQAKRKLSKKAAMAKKRKAAAGSKGSGSAKAATDVNYLDLPDDEFIKKYS